MQEPNRLTRTRAGAGAALFVCLALALAACAGTGASALPSVNLPTLPPSGVAGACLDAQTMAIIDQLKASGADVPGIVAANKDKLVTGLGQLKSSDPIVVAWRDAFVAAIQAGKADDVAAQVALLANGQANGQISIRSC
jgi:hypothetical protein